MADEKVKEVENALEEAVEEPDERLESSYVSTARRCYDLTDCAKQLQRHPPHIGNRCQTSTLTLHINLLR